MPRASIFAVEFSGHRETPTAVSKCVVRCRTLVHVVSLLDWDLIIAEMRRVLAPGGRILIVDMAASPVR